MIITRRKMVAGLAAGSSAALILPRKSWAPPPPSSTAGVWAAKFDASTWLKRDQSSNLFPSQSPYFACSYWYNRSVHGTFDDIIRRLITADGFYNLDISHHQGQPANHKVYPPAQLVVATSNQPAGGASPYWSSNPILPHDGLWHLVQISADLTIPAVQVRLDKTPVIMNLSPGTGVAGSIRYFAGHNNLVPYWQIGTMVQSVAEQFFYAGALIDLSAVEAGFIDANNEPVRQPPDGSDAIPGVLPQDFLSGGKDMFPLNLTGATWNDGLSGNFTDSSPPSSFYVAAGTLLTASVDPWGENGTT